MTMESDDERGKIGYKRPPRHTRFQAGQSGNPRGRQKGVSNLATDVKRTLKVPVRLNEQGKPRKVSTQEAILLRLREKALKGDSRSLDRLVALAQTFNNDATSESPGGKAIALEDQAILDAYAAEVQSRPAASIAIRLSGDDHDDGPNADG